MATLLQDDIFQLVREPIDMAALARHVRAPEDGATVTFDGFVRNQSHDRPTLYLDYEAYESMALAKMREIGAQLHEKYRIHRVAMVHLLGRGSRSPRLAPAQLPRRVRLLPLPRPPLPLQTASLGKSFSPRRRSPQTSHRILLPSAAESVSTSIL